MAKIALIQNLFPMLHSKNSNQLTGLSKQLYDKFFEILVEESGHELQQETSLEAYQAAEYDQPDLVICTPIPEIGNVAPGLAELAQIRQAFPDTPLIVWAIRNEEAIRRAVLEDYQAVAYYTGTLVDASDYFADMVLELT